VLLCQAGCSQHMMAGSGCSAVAGQPGHAGLLQDSHNDVGLYGRSVQQEASTCGVTCGVTCMQRDMAAHQSALAPVRPPLCPCPQPVTHLREQNLLAASISCRWSMAHSEGPAVPLASLGWGRALRKITLAAGTAVWGAA
jgi:hypothetical protein